jgi:hypothetical protein
LRGIGDAADRWFSLDKREGETMRRIGVHVVALVAVVTGIVIMPKARAEGGIPKQANVPSACAKSNGQCVRGWYQEYKAAIIGELGRWRQFEPRVAAAIRRKDDLDAHRMLGQAMDGGWYVHNHWEIADNSEIVDAGVVFEEWDAVFADCRAAIIHLKFLIIAISGAHWEDIQSDRADYVKAVTKCERFFKLTPANTALRR